MRRILSLVLTLLIMAAFAGCGINAEGATLGGPVSDGSAGGGAQNGAASGAKAASEVVYDDGYGKNVLRLALDERIEHVDVQFTTNDYTIPMNLYDNLVEVRANEDGTSEIVGALAESWDVSGDGLVYTFHLRSNVKFHNGETLEADDVVYTVERMLAPDRLTVNTNCMDMIRGAAEMMSGVAEHCSGVRAVDASTVEITLTQAYAPFLANCCVPGFAIYNREAGEAFDAAGEPSKYDVGTGPFVMKDWVKDDHIYIEAFPDYWKGAALIDGVLFRLVMDDEERRELFESGAIDEFDLESAMEQIPYYVNSEKWADNVVTRTRVGTFYYSINEAIEPFGDVRVRQALQCGIDRQSILDTIYMGAGIVANGIYAPGMVGYDPNMPTIRYDPERARQLLKEAGYENGFDMTISQFTDNPTTLAINEIVQTQLSEYGINVTIDQMSEAEWMEVRRTGALPMYTTSWSADFNDPDNFIYTFFSPSNSVSRSFNYFNAEAMERVVNARYMVDEAARVEEYRQLERQIVFVDAAWIPLFHLQHIWVFSDRVQNFVPHWAGWNGGYYWYITLD